MKNIIGKLGAFLKSATKDKRFYIVAVFLCVSLAAAIISVQFPISAVPYGYSGDYPKTFKGINTVKYTKPLVQYESTDWKDYKSPANNLYIYRVWHSWHWGDSGISKTEATGDNAVKIMYELSKLKPTGETAEAITDTSGENLYDTYFLQTIDSYYRIPNDNTKIIIKVDDYYGAGEVYTLPEETLALIREVYSGRGKKDIFAGKFENGVMSITKNYDGKTIDSLIMTDFVVETKEKHGYEHYAVFTFTAAKSGKYGISGSIVYSEDLFSIYEGVAFEAKKGRPVTVKVPFSTTQKSYSITFICGDVTYRITVHNH